VPLACSSVENSPQQDHPVRAAAGTVNHAVNNVEIAPAALLVVGAAAHQAVAGLRRALLGEVVLQQLHHGGKPLADLPVAEVLRPGNQLARQKIKLAGGHFHVRHIRYGAVADAAHKARVAQAQDRHQPDQVAGKLVNALQRNRVTLLVEKLAQGENAVVFRHLAFQAVENTVVAVVARHPARRHRAKAANAMAARLGLPEGQNNVQVLFAPGDVPRRKPEVVMRKVVKVILWRQEQG